MDVLGCRCRMPHDYVYESGHVWSPITYTHPPTNTHMLLDIHAVEVRTKT